MQTIHFTQLIRTISLLPVHDNKKNTKLRVTSET